MVNRSQRIGPNRLGPALAATLDRLAEAASGLAEPWWVFGSAAAALLGLDLEPADVDVIASPGDARLLAGRLGAEVRVTGHPRFQSDYFAVAGSTPLPVEVMSGFRIRVGEVWTPVRPQTRVLVPWGEGALPVPAAAEQARICRLLGRPKDLERAARLEALAG